MDRMAQHFAASFDVVQHPTGQGTRYAKRPLRSTDHASDGFTNSEQLRFPGLIAEAAKRGFFEHDSRTAHIDPRVRCSKIDRKVGSTSFEGCMLCRCHKDALAESSWFVFLVGIACVNTTVARHAASVQVGSLSLLWCRLSLTIETSPSQSCYLYRNAIYNEKQKWRGLRSSESPESVAN